MDILDDMGVSKLSVKVFFFFLSKLPLQLEKSGYTVIRQLCFSKTCFFKVGWIQLFSNLKSFIIYFISAKPVFV